MDNYYLISHGTLSEIADSIREKKGISDGLQVSDFAEQISSIEGSSIEYESVSVNIKNNSAAQIWITYTTIGSSRHPQETNISISSGNNITIKALNNTSVYVSSANLVTPITVSKSMGTGNNVFKCDAVGSIYILTLTTTNATSLIVGANSAALTATSSKVLKGETFVGTSGYGVGTLEIPEGEGITLEEFGLKYVSGEINPQGILSSIEDTAIEIREGCFFGSADIYDVTLNKVTSIGEYAFCGCSYIQSIHLPECTSLELEAFGLYYTENYDMGGYQTFQRVDTPYIYFPKIEYVREYALNDMFVDPADLSNAVSLDAAANLQNRSGNTVMHCGSLTLIRQGWINSLGITEAYLPSCFDYTWWSDYQGMHYSAFAGCQALRFLTIAPIVVHCDDFTSNPNLFEMTLPIAPPDVEEYSWWGDATTFGGVFGGTPIYDGRGVIRVPDEHYENYLQHWFWGQTPIVSISEAGLKPFSSTPHTILVGQTKTYEIGYTYGWNLGTTYMDCFDVFGYIQVEDAFIDFENQILKVTVTAIAPSQEVNNAEAVCYYLEDTEQGHVCEGQFDFRVIEPPTDFSILPEPYSTYGFDYYGPGIYTLQSNNSGYDDTTAETKVQLLIPHDGTLYLDWYIESEGCCDKGSISSIDSTTYPTNQVYGGNSSTTPNTGTLSLPIEVGEHFIYLKYRKDSSVGHGIDAFRVTFRFE